MKHVQKVIPDFFRIPYQMILDRDLRSTDREVYAAILFYSEERESSCYATNSEIAAIILSTATTVSNTLKRLEDRGYITRDFGDGTDVPLRKIIPLAV